MIDTLTGYATDALNWGWQIYLFLMLLILVSALGKYAWGWITGKYR